MSSWLSVALAVFGVLYVAVSLALLDGPFDLFARWRQWVGQSTWVGRGFHCPQCLSLWLAILPALFLADSLRAFFFVWLGLAGAAAFLYKAGWRS